MSVLRQLNLLGQMRIDVPHLRSIESSIAADFDVVAGRVQAGEKAAVIRGFSLANFGAGTAANSVQLATADGIVYNMNASEAGTFLWVPADRDVETLNSATNARVYGSFTAGQVNYIGLDLIRSADTTTSDLVQFLDPNTLLENAKSVPLGRTLDYRIVISTTPFSATPNLVPIAKIKTDVGNNVDSAAGSVQDARNILWRLGSGGDFPNRFSSFSWAQNRSESSTGSEIFTGGDKAIQSQKDWMDAVMTRIWELGGGESWYSATADRNVRMVRTAGSTFATTGDNFEWVITGLYVSGSYPRHLHWQGLKIVFDNSNTAAVYYNTVVDQTGDDAAGTAVASKTALADGDCIYVDIDRTSNAAVTAKKAALQTLSVPSVPGSRYVLAWRVGADIFTRDSSLAVNVSFQPATTTLAGAVRLNQAPNVAHAASGVPTVVNLNTTNSISVGTVYPVTGVATPAIVGTGSADAGPGVVGNGGLDAEAGVIGVGSGTGQGGSFTGGADGNGVSGQATGAGATGVLGLSTNGDGGFFQGAGAGNGVVATAVGTGIGVVGTGGNIGGDFAGGTSYGVRATATGSTVLAHALLATGNAGGSHGIRAIGGDVNASTPAVDATFYPGYGAGVVGAGGAVYGGIGVSGYGGGTSLGHGTPYLGSFVPDGHGGYFVGVTSSTATGGGGLLAKGGSGGGAVGTGGVAVTGVGGASPGTGTAGAGAYLKGGDSVGGIGGHGVLGIGGTGPTNGSGGFFTSSGAAAAIVANPTGTGKALAISTNGNIAYTSGRSMKKVLGGASFKYTVSTDDNLDKVDYQGPVVSTNQIGLNNPSGTTTLTLFTEFVLPLNAVITSVRIAARHSGSVGGITANVSFQRQVRSDTLTPGTDGWVSTPVLTASNINPGPAAGAASEIFTPAVNAVAANRTASSFDDVFGLQMYFSVPTAAYFYIYWVEVNYTMFDTIQG